MKNPKKTITDLRFTANEKLGKCLSSEYSGVKAHYDWECEHGHTWSATADSILRGSWCPNCAGQKKITIDDMREICQKKGGEFLSEKYINQHTIYKVKCGEGHVFYPHGQSLSRGSWCKICQSARLWQKDRSKVSRDDYILAGIQVNCELLSLQIPNRTTIKAQWKCNKKGHVFSMTYNNIKNHKQNCPKCSGKGKVTIADCISIAETRNGEFLSETYNPYELQVWKCKDGHEFKSKYSTIKSQSIWCPYCSSGVGERVCRFIFESIFEVPFLKVRPTWLLNNEGNRLELDGFSDHLKIAFEHNGKQHYSEKYHRGTKKLLLDDKIKIEKCKQFGVNLIVVPEIPSLLPFEDSVNFITHELIKKGIEMPLNVKIPKIDSSFRWSETIEDERAKKIKKAQEYIVSKNAVLNNVELKRRGKQYVLIFNVTTVGGAIRSLTEHLLFKDDLWSKKMRDPLTGEEFYKTNGSQIFASKQNSWTYNNMKKLGKLK